MRDDLGWETTLDGKRPWMEDSDWWKEEQIFVLGDGKSFFLKELFFVLASV